MGLLLLVELIRSRSYEHKQLLIIKHAHLCSDQNFLLRVSDKSLYARL